ncbi:hypothetical protein B0H19DRAFT_1264916 [Mycena capillaripes]|nr:hypothetical protein B0H19DRAFT_1264916 [Mycena capillaripes]
MDLQCSQPVSDPKLPPEVERIIFEIAALLCPIHIPKLILIAWRVKEWVELLLYRVVQFMPRQMDGAPPPQIRLPAFTSQILLKKIAARPQFIDSSVRHLFIGGVVVRSPAILMACTGVTNLVMENATYAHLAALGSLKCLRRLVVDVQMLFKDRPMDSKHPVFRHMTHLELLDDYRSNDHHRPPRTRALCALLARIHHLAHVAFNTIPVQPDLLDALLAGLRANARLECIVLLSPDPGVIDRARSLADDSRFVCLERADYRASWLRGTGYGEGDWDLADAFIAARRAGRVDSSEFIIHDDDDSWRT